MSYIESLRLHLEKKYPQYFLSGNVHYGQMDYTYFYFFPRSFKRHGLKIVILFVHDTFAFEAWLSGYNKSVQARYWKQFKENNWGKYPLASIARGVDYITKVVLVDNPDFSNLDYLTNQIETETLKFIEDVEHFLSKTENS